MDDAVADGVREGGIREVVMPVVRRELARDDRRACSVAVLEKLQEMATFLVADGGDREVVDDEHIEEDLVARYGPKIRAFPHEGALTTLLAASAFLIVAVGALGFWSVRRWRHSNDDGAPLARNARDILPRPRDDYDARIDAELADLD